VKVDPDRERLIVDSAPKKLRIESEVYSVFVGRNFVPVIDVIEIKTGREYFLIVYAQSISRPLAEWIRENNSSAMHIEFWINKKSDQKTAPYELELA